MRKITLLLLCLLLQACTQTQKELGNSVRQAFFGADDVQKTDAQINSSPYASMYLRINNGAQIYVVLGFSEQGQQKWITHDRAMVVTWNGRLVKTLDLADNLLEVTNLQQDPLADIQHLQPGARWTRTLTWTEQGQLRAATAVSRFSRQPDQVLKLAGNPVNCQVWQEDVATTDGRHAWRNTFWIDRAGGQVRQSEQMLGAVYFPLKTTLLKPAR